MDDVCYFTLLEFLLAQNHPDSFDNLNFTNLSENYTRENGELGPS